MTLYVINMWVNRNYLTRLLPNFILDIKIIYFRNNIYGIEFSIIKQENLFSINKVDSI